MTWFSCTSLLFALDIASESIMMPGAFSLRIDNLSREQPFSGKMLTLQVIESVA